MAEDRDNKTEPATEKRKADARKDGNIAVSRDVTTAGPPLRRHRAVGAICRSRHASAD